MDVLVTGNTGYFTKDTLLQAFPDSNIVVCDSYHEEKKEGNIRWFNKLIMSDEFRRLFATYGFERVVFLSHFLTKDSRGIGEIEELRQVLTQTQRFPIKQFVYITSDEALLDVENSASIIFRSAEELCNYYATAYQVQIKIIYSPYLMSGSYKDDYFCRILSKLERGEKAEVKALKDEIAPYLSVDDLSVFIFRLFDGWEENLKGQKFPFLEKIYLTSGAKTTYDDIYDDILRYYPDAELDFIRSGIKGRINYGENKARKDYGWFASRDACENFREYIEEYKRNFYQKPSFQQRLWEKLKLNSRFMMVVELIFGAALVELYNYYAGGSVQFRMIDVRLLLVVLMASVYGTSIGAITSFIEIGSLIYAYQKQGTNVLMLFYDPGNWIPFILLMVTAAVCGYVKQKKDEDQAFIKDENEVIKSENRFISALYQEAMEYKNQYKQDLIGSRDGFGRIFDVVKRLSTTVPEEIFAESIPVMEDVLGNKSIAIYTINDRNARFARLNVSSEPISSKLKKSINLENYREVLDTVSEKEIWFNAMVQEGFPTYVSGIKTNGVLSVLILIYHVDYVQMGTYYTNLIRILTGLMENFIIKAWEYQKAVAAKTFVEGTSITRTEYFLQQYEIQKEMAEKGLTSFRLFRIMTQNRDLAELDELFQPKIRNNDILGIGSDGNIYLLASQVDESSEGIVLRRFRDLGLKCDVVRSVA